MRVPGEPKGASIASRVTPASLTLHWIHRIWACAGDGRLAARALLGAPRMRRPLATATLLALAAACGGKVDAGSDRPPLAENDASPYDAHATSDAGPPSVPDAAQLPCGPDSGAETTIATLGLPASGFQYEGLAIVANGGDIYWSVRAIPTTAGMVLKVPRCGGAVTTLASDQTDPVTLVVQGDTVFWGTMGDDNSGTPHGTVMRAPTTGGSATALVTGTAIYLGNMAVGATAVYSVAWLSPVSSSSGAWEVPIDGGAPVGLGPEQIFTSIAVDAQHVFLATAVGDVSESQIQSVPLSGGDPTVLVPSGVGSMPIVLDEASIYYLSLPSTLTRIAKGGGTPESIADTRTTVPPAVDDAYVYWVEGNVSNGIADAVKRAPKAATGAGTTTLSSSYATAIAVDDAYVYWLKAGNVVRRAK